MQKSLALVLFASVCARMSAESIKIANWPFEDVSGTDPLHFDSAGKLRPGHYVTFSPPFDSNGLTRPSAIPGWSGFGVAGSMAALAGNVSGRQFTAIPDGKNTAFFAEDVIVEQTLTNRIQVDTRYTLQVDVGRPFSTAEDPDWGGSGLILKADGRQVMAATVPAGLLPGEFRTLEASYSVAAADGFVGKMMGLLMFGGIGEVHFDNVRLTAVSLVAPIATISAAVEVSWLSKPGEWYRVQRAANLSSPQWEAITAPLQGTGGRLSVFEVAGAEVAYYRLLPVPPP